MQSFSLIQNSELSLRHSQKLLINLAMRQALHVLQLPQIELAEWLHAEIEKNPILELDFSDDPSEEFFLETHGRSSSFCKVSQELEGGVVAVESLYEHLMKQAGLAFENDEEKSLAELIIGHLNEEGFLDTPFKEISPTTSQKKMEEVLNVIQTFEPAGIAARSFQESFLLQLNRNSEGETMAKRLIRNHFNDLLDRRFSKIAKKLGICVDEVLEVVEKQIALLSLRPGALFSPSPVALRVPDLFFLFFEGKWKIEVGSSYLPRFQIAPSFHRAISQIKANKLGLSFLRKHMCASKWLRRIIDQRKQTLLAIGHLILETQKEFLNGEARGLLPMTMKEAATALGIHESTVARAVSGKWVSCPQGLFSLRSFFGQGLRMGRGKISNHSLRELLSSMINAEDKNAPLSDQQIVEKFRKTGIVCARRTVNKYRSMLKIGSALHRRKSKRGRSVAI